VNRGEKVFIHLGGKRMIQVSEVVAIIDVNHSNASDPYFSFLKTAEERGCLERIVTDEIKSYVVTNKKIYGSPISSLTLMKRAELCQNYRKRI
jgi:hypothetical protein